MFNFSSIDIATPISLVKIKDYPSWLAQQTMHTQNWLSGINFQAKACNVALIPDESCQLLRVLCCLPDKDYFWTPGLLPLMLPEGTYYFDDLSDLSYEDTAIAWGLGAYQFSRYKKPERKPAQLKINKEKIASVINIVDSIYLVRDLINTPTDHLGPTEFAKVISDLADKQNAEVSDIVGEELLKQNYPCIYTVGRASDDQPRLLELRWGEEKHPKVTLVGKGVCFDSGGLNIKPAGYMQLMKKDMGGAAHVLGLANMIMTEKLPIRLRVLIPLVENVISGNAYHPGDVIRSRKGLTIEIGNTDAEGRLILCDALAAAVEEKPELLIDIATLTGAARVALGTELPVLFCNQDDLAHEVISYGEKVADPMWRLPLYPPYRDFIKSQIADLSNDSSEPTGGAITAALFLNEFVPDDIPWMHFDLMAWNNRVKPGRPQGGEAFGIRALFHFLQHKFGE